MNLKRNIVGIGVVCLPLMLGACASNTSSLQARVDAQGEAAVTAHKLGSQIEVQQLAGDYTGGMYRARVVLENLKNKQQDLQYQFSWYDSAGAEVGGERGPWTPLVIYGKDQKTLMAVAPTPGTTSFQVSVRDLKANKTFKTNFLGRR